MFCQGQCKTAFMEAIKSKGIFKDYLKQKKPPLCNSKEARELR